MFRRALTTLIFVLVMMFGIAAYAERAVVTRVKATYPELAKRMNLQGSVTVKAMVGADGKVKSVSLMSGNPILAQAAANAVKQWVYAPGAEESVVVEMTFSQNGN